MLNHCLFAIALIAIPTTLLAQDRKAPPLKQSPANQAPAKPTVGQSARLTPEYPKQSKLPDDLPWYEEREGKFREINRISPVANYVQRHYDGWQLCLEDFAISGRKLSECEWEPLGVAVVEPYSFQGHEDGYNACRKNLAALVKLSDEERVRTEAKRFYKPREPWASFGRHRTSVIYGKPRVSQGAIQQAKKTEATKRAAQPRK